MNKMGSWFCDSIIRMIIDAWLNVALSDLHVKHHILTNALNW
jgi:hypothetical protein